MKITILVENSVYRSGLGAEHGLALYIETDTSKVLFDTGQSHLIRKNAAFFDIDLESIDAIFLSHGHYDHTGGLKALRGKGTPVFGHPDIFKHRFSRKRNGEVSAVGNPYGREEIESSGFRFVLERGQNSFGGFFLTGEVPQIYDFETRAKHFFHERDLRTIDPILDDQSLYFDTSEGLVVLLGCCHSGLMNTLSHILRTTGAENIHWIIGGTHLLKADDERMLNTVNELRGVNFSHISPLHCSGLQGQYWLKSHFPSRFVPLSCGDEIKIP